MSDITKSLREIFDERISSPFYGSLIVSWLLWNWKISYVTFFVDKEKITGTKIDYIVNNCNNIWHLLIFPLLSTGVILMILPYVTNYAYLVTLKFDQWRINKKNEVESKRLLTLEESMHLRVEMQNLHEKYAIMITDKDKEIASLRQQLADAMKDKRPKIEKTESISVESKRIAKEQEEFNEFMKEKGSAKFDEVISGINRGYGLGYVDNETSKLFVGYGIVELVGSTYLLSEKGKRFYQEYSKRTLKSQRQS